MEHTKTTEGNFRKIKKVIRARAASDGAGVNLYRSLGGFDLPDLDPFLMLDEFRSDNPNDYIAGFPPHPHRGFETVTYMLAGSMQHEDSTGNSGNLVSGSVQWMTAARGIIHSEMPKQEDGLMWGFQLWVNLPASEKMKAPFYQDIPPEAIPEYQLDGGIKIRAIAGDLGGIQGAVKGIAVEPIYLDIFLPPNTEWVQTVPQGHNAFAYVFEGQVNVGSFDQSSGTWLSEKDLGVFTDGKQVRIHTKEQSGRFIFLAGKPIQEPIVKHGPFVMNSKDEIYQAIHDYQTGQFITA